MEASEPFDVASNDSVERSEPGDIIYSPLDAPRPRIRREEATACTTRTSKEDTQKGSGSNREIPTYWLLLHPGDPEIREVVYCV